MEPEALRAVASEYYDALNRRDVEALLALCSEDAQTWVAGSGPFSGWHPVSRKGLEAFFGAFEELHFRVLAMTAEGDRVALEIESEGRMGGAPYSNQYHNLIVVRDGRVAVLKEYFDTARVGG